MRRALMAAITVAAFALPSVAQARDDFNSKPFRQKVTIPNILVHERALQRFADANGGTRAAGTPGNTATTDYVLRTMRAAGWSARLQPFQFPFFQETAPATFEQTAPAPRTFVEGGDDVTSGFALMTYSGSGDVTGAVTPVDVTVPMDPAAPASTSNSGCEAADFAGFPAGAIALVQRGTCTFDAKARNAKAAGASAVVVFNEGQAAQPGQPERQAVLQGTLTAPGDGVEPIGIPVVGIGYQLGADTVTAIRGGATVTWHLATQTISEERTTNNVIADSPFGDPDRTVVVSAHNDSVLAGPGINDDGSGTSMDLELARQLGRSGGKPENHVRFLWVGAEELGLLGSQFYVDSLTDAERAQIIAMLDFDMVASPNWARQVYDGDGSTFGPDVSGPNGSGFIESLFNRWFDGRGQAHEPIPFDGRSDYVAFTDAGIPAGGTFTGADAIKTAQEQLLFGGIAGEQLDQCYHQACDTIDNLDLDVFADMKDAAADVLFQLANTRNPIVDGGTIKGHGDAGRRHGRANFQGETARR
jgi:Zn-dependent M28 family amino/carboxypeptidase